MKYFQTIADIEKHYTEIKRNFNNNKYSIGLLESWSIYPKDKPYIEEEAEVLRYLVGCQLGFVRDTKVKKPTLAVVQRLFNRHLAFLKEVHGCHEGNVNKHPSILSRKEYKACKHYLFKFSLPGWVKKLPKELLTVEEKYNIRDKNKRKESV